MASYDTYYIILFFPADDAECARCTRIAPLENSSYAL